ncbi:hypothetical protein GCM10011414_27040 [Croceivirga lutea]|nr:hypothetical protein GCM10011414_27040 [Croceivirga lutea]
MLKNMRTYYTLLMVIVLTFVSCSEDLNVNQADDLAIEPTVASSIFYFESTEEVINLAGTGGFYSEQFVFEAFSESFINDKVLDGIITYQISNTTSKAIELQIEFFDASGNTLDSEQFSIEANPAPETEIQVAYGNGGKSIQILRNTSQIRVNGINLGDGTSTSTQENPKIILKSSAAFRIKIR